MRTLPLYRSPLTNAVRRLRALADHGLRLFNWRVVLAVMVNFGIWPAAILAGRWLLRVAA